jgi:hypothetical protein
MEIFHESNREKFLWMGFHQKHGWVILDRLLHPNKGKHKTGDHLYFVRCLDWTIYKEEKLNWGEPDYIFVINYLENLDEAKKKLNEEEGSKILHEFLNNKREDFHRKYIETIHNNYLTKKGSKTTKAVKAIRRRDSVCWSCRDTVDNKFDYECSACGWIICSNCGACKQYGC